MLDEIQRSMGMVPNMMKVLAHSPAALSAYLRQSQALGGVFDARLREQIALAVAGVNGCDYCASAHTLMAKNLGIGADELADNLHGRSSDSRTQAVLRFAKEVVESHGTPSEGAFADVRAAGFGEAELTELLSLVALNIFTNYFNLAAETEIDFPKVDTSTAVRGGAR